MSLVPYEGVEGGLAAQNTTKDVELVIKTRNLSSKNKFPLGSFQRENGTTLSEIPFIPENFQCFKFAKHVSDVSDDRHPSSVAFQSLTPPPRLFN